MGGILELLEIKVYVIDRPQNFMSVDVDMSIGSHFTLISVLFNHAFMYGTHGDIERE